MSDNESRSKGVHGRNINKFVQDDTSTERICSDLEQLKYAQILTSLAMGPLFTDRHDGVLSAQQENTARSLGKSDEGLNGDRNEFSRREKRRVKPTKKVQEWNKANFARPLGTKRNARDKRGSGDAHGNNLVTEDGNVADGNTEGTLQWVDYMNLKKTGSEGRKETAADCSMAQEEAPGEKTMVNVLLGNKCESTALKKNSRYRCDQCGKCFKTYYTYSIHIRMPDHTEETPFVCDICGKGFRLSSTLCRHKIIHTSNKPHQCKICSKTFNRSSTLKMHMRTHSGRKQHVCAECGKGFHQKGNLRNHMFVHSGERPFHCESCGRLFNKKSNLKHHLKIHEINGKLACTVCKTMFPRNEELRKHMEMVHCK